MYLRDDYSARLAAAVATRPNVATAYQAGDPRILAGIEAVAAMLAMHSAQIDLAETEPFLKARDGTVLADAALKGILPLGKSARVSLTVINSGAAAVSLAAGRDIVDTKGRHYSIESSAIVPASGTATLTATQATTRTITQTVAGTVPFYAIQVPPSPDGLVMVGLSVADQLGSFTYTPEFCNINPGDRIFHVETDEYRRLYVRFGANDSGLPVIGSQPGNGDVITITVTECEGAISLDAGTPFALSTSFPGESSLSISLASVVYAGADPPSMETLRVLSRYKALYDSNAVYLGDFDFLLRRKLTGIEFLSVWNEQAEEAARGASVNNINKLFVAFVINGQSTADSQAQIRAIVKRADSSLKVVFVNANVIDIPLTVDASVSVIHDVADVQAQISAVVLTKYGAGSVLASRGLSNTFRYQAISADLKAGVTALQDNLSDFSVTIGATSSPLPEDYRRVTVASLTVNVTRVQNTTGLLNV